MENLPLPIHIHINGKITEPINTFINKISSAFSTLYEPKKIIKRAKAEAESRLIHAKTDIDIEELRNRSLIRNELLELRRQVNLESIVLKSTKFLPTEKLDSDIDEDWIINFLNAAQDISNEDMQIIWAKILAGEYSKPNSYSLRTIQFVKTLAKAEAHLFTMFCTLVSTLSGGMVGCVFQKIEDLHDFGFEFLTMKKLRDIGFVSEFFNLNLEKGTLKLSYFGNKLLVKKRHEIKGGTRIGAFNYSFFPLTSVGFELFPIAGANRNNDYWKSLVNFFPSNLFEIEID